MKDLEIKEIGLSGSGGICIDGDIRMSFRRSHSAMFLSAFRVLLALMATFATAVLANSFTNAGMGKFVLLYNSVVAVVGLSLIFSKHNVIRICSGLVLFMYIYPVLRNLKMVKYGFMVAANGYLTMGELPDQSTGIYKNFLTTSEAVDQSLYYFFTAIIFVLALGAVVACVIRIDFPVMFIFTFPIMELGLYLGFDVPAYAALMIIVTWVTLLAINMINHTTNKAGRRNTFAVHERSRTFYFTSSEAKSEFYAVYMRFVAFITAGVFISIVLLSALVGYERPKSFSELRYNLHHAVERFNIAHADDFLIDVNGGSNLFGVTSVGGTNGGILGTSNGISFNGSKALIMKTEGFDHPMYLRGYVAGQYQDNRWNPLPTDDVISEIHDELEPIGAWIQDYDFLMLTGNDELTGSRKATMDITVKGACAKFVYAPYATQYIYTYANDTDNGMTPYNDSYVRISQSSKKYTLSYKNFSAGNWFYRAENLSWMGLQHPGELDGPLTVYDNYVHNNYTEAIDLESLNAVYDEICSRYLVSDPEYCSYSEICRAIQNYFSDNRFTYTLSPGRTPDGRDFIDYFLTEQREGYCTYFATVGVQLMRKFGYPARYVEGYMVLPTQLNNSPLDGLTYEVTVKDKCAHAWTEVFIDGVGWMPAEFTPGYDNDNPNLSEEEKGLTSKRDESSKAESSSEAESSSSSKNDSSSSSRPSNSNPNSRSDSSKSSGGSGNGGGGTGKGGGSGSKNSSGSKSGDGSSSKSGSLINPNGGGGNGGVGGGDVMKLGRPYSPVVKTVMMTMFAVIVSVAAVVLNRRRCLNKMRESCSQSDLNKRVLAIYTYSLKYLSVLNIEVKKNISDMQMCSELLNQCHEQNIRELDDKLTELTIIAVKSHMNPDSITEEEAVQAEEIMRCISDKVVANKLSALSMLSAKYLYCLY